MSKRMDILLRIATLALATTLAAREVVLKPGITELDEPMVLDATEGEIQLLGAQAGSTLKASARFQGAALIVARGLKHLSIERLKLDGSRSLLDRSFPIAPYDRSFAEFYPLNGILLDNCEGAILRNLEIRNVVNFPILVTRSKQIRIHAVRIEYSGSLDESGKNNTTGGILFEEGTADFEVRFVKMRAIRGNGIWTHSRYESPRNRDGLIHESEVNGSARDAIQVGHATNIRVLKNLLVNIGFPIELVDTAHGGIPVGIDTAGDVDKSLYAENVMQEVSGKWSGSQTLSGPILVIPYKVHEKVDRGKNGIEIIERTEKYFFLPETLNISGEINPKILQRGMFDAVVYGSTLNVNAAV